LLLVVVTLPVQEKRPRNEGFCCCGALVNCGNYDSSRVYRAAWVGCSLPSVREVWEMIEQEWMPFLYAAFEELCLMIILVLCVAVCAKAYERFE